MVLRDAGPVRCLRIEHMKKQTGFELSTGGHPGNAGALPMRIRGFDQIRDNIMIYIVIFVVTVNETLLCFRGVFLCLIG